jgi:creatinine amidohydrolase/Fe(II)-dependent formamide hydrolase-like protein
MEGYGGEIMTSVMLFLRPELVNMDKTKAEYVQNNAESNSFIIKGSLNAVQFKDYHVNFFRLTHEVTESGATSDPIKARREKGQKIVNKWVSYLSAFLEEFKKEAHHEIKRKSP